MHDRPAADPDLRAFGNVQAVDIEATGQDLTVQLPSAGGSEAERLVDAGVEVFTGGEGGAGVDGVGGGEGGADLGGEFVVAGGVANDVEPEAGECCGGCVSSGYDKEVGFCVELCG